MTYLSKKPESFNVAECKLVDKIKGGNMGITS